MRYISTVALLSLLAFNAMAAPTTKGAKASPKAAPVTKGAKASPKPAPVTKGASYKKPASAPKAAPAQTISAVAALRLGWDWAQVGKSQHVQLLNTDPAPDLFKTSQANSNGFLYGGFLGLEFPLKTEVDLRWQTGIAYYQTTSFQTKGVDYFFSLPQFGDKSYSYKITNQRMMVENKLLYGFHDRIYVYGLAGVGVGFNNAYAYHERAIDPNTPANGVFNSNSVASISYSVGAGLDFVLASNWIMSLGYQFSDLGDVALGTYNNGNTSDTLKMPNTLTQELVLSLGFMF
jgi:opacity protein-like surface antigen